MVAKITIPNSVKRVLNYNEQKVKEGVAECISAQGYLKDVDQLNFHEKLNRLERQISLNKRATTNAVHISLNFALGEKLGHEKLAEIASTYMTKIGFEDQPYLVYQHLDAGHPHIHIVSTNIQKDGKRISLHNIGKNQSAKARREIEIAYKLTRVEDQKSLMTNELKAFNTQRVIYGKSATKRGITNVLDTILPAYKYSSLAELNAVLKLYNVVGDRGAENGVIYRKGGLVYRVLDDTGNKIGVPIKASSIYNKPTLSYLETRFRENEQLKSEYKKNLRSAIDWVLRKPMKSIVAYKTALEKEKISLVVRQNESGLVYGLTYVDHNTKCVFNGSDIGKEYSAKAILAKCGINQSVNHPESEQVLNHSISAKTSSNDSDLSHDLKKDVTHIVHEIITPIEQFQWLPYHLKKRKRRKTKFH